MKVATLQQFLRSIGGPFSAVGVSQPSLIALTSCADALEPFHGLELADLADLLRRADEARRTGSVPLVDVPVLAPVGELSRDLAKDAKLVVSADGEDAKETERRINKHRHDLQNKLVDFAQQFGITIKCTETDNWVSLLRGRKIIERLKGAITSPDSYREPSVETEITTLVELGDQALKQLAAEHSASITKKKGRQIADAILAEVTKHQPPGTKATKAKAPGADQAAIDAIVRVIKEKVELVKNDPRALADAEVEDLIGQVKSKQFGAKQKQAIASAVVGAKVTNTDDAILRLRSALAGVKQNLDGQKT